MLCSLQVAGKKKTGNPVGIRAAWGWVELSCNARWASVDVGGGEQQHQGAKDNTQCGAVAHSMDLLRVLFGNQLQHSLCQYSEQNKK